MSERYLKQVIVVRKDLTMPTGKLAAMVAHASMTFILKRLLQPGLIASYSYGNLVRGVFSTDEWRWMTELDPGIEDRGQVSMAKIVCSIGGLEELIAVDKAAHEANLETHHVFDSGHSHNKPGTFACIAIGPDWPERLDPITGGLKVYR